MASEFEIVDRFLKRPAPQKNNSFARIARELGGQLHETPAGPVIHLASKTSPTDRYGRLRLKEIWREDASALGGLEFLVKEPPPGNVALEDLLFLDCETTGLATAAGTYAFLVGLGAFRGQTFHLEQIFLPDYSCEKAFLQTLLKKIRPGTVLVTYNGKSFDVPLLQTRFILNRLAFPLAELPHVDLLFPARRIWRYRLADLSLRSLERELLGAERERDIDSGLIPGTYFHYLRSGDVSYLPDVLAHNRYDILTLAFLTLWHASLLATPQGYPNLEPCDYFGLGRLYYQKHEVEKAVWCLEQAWGKAEDETLKGLAGTLLSLIHKRRENWPEATNLWQAMSRLPLRWALYATEELAKHYEHRARDYSQALRMVENALATFAFSEPEHIHFPLERWEKRKVRLLCKQKRPRQLY